MFRAVAELKYRRSNSENSLFPETIRLCVEIIIFDGNKSVENLAWVSPCWARWL